MSSPYCQKTARDALSAFFAALGTSDVLHFDCPPGNQGRRERPACPRRPHPAVSLWRCGVSKMLHMTYRFGGTHRPSLPRHGFTGFIRFPSGDRLSCHPSSARRQVWASCEKKTETPAPGGARREPERFHRRKQTQRFVFAAINGPPLPDPNSGDDGLPRSLWGTGWAGGGCAV